MQNQSSNESSDTKLKKNCNIDDIFSLGTVDLNKEIQGR